MKLRIRGDSLRLRVGPTEAKAIAAGKPVVERISFGPSDGQTLTCILEAVEKILNVQATFESNCIRVRLPMNAARSWVQSDAVGIEESQPIDGRRSLALLIEKDFECLDHPGEEEDTYANPVGSAGCPVIAK